jgi:GT2 family glycosyltransferase
MTVPEVIRVEAGVPQVSVVIGTLNRRWYLERTIASVRAEMRPPEAEIIVVDGGSEDGTIRWLARQKDVITIVQHNRGRWRGKPVPRRSWGYFMNLAFRAASARYVCMLSDDCLVVPGAIRNGLRRLEGSGERVGAVAFYWRNWPDQERYRVGVGFGDRLFVNHGLFAREALAAVGYVDERAFRFYHADTDLALRLDAAGWRCIDSPESYVEHYKHANLPLRSSNTESHAADWAAYTARWSHLGAPSQNWLLRSFADPNRTAARYWGRRKRWAARFTRGRTWLRALPGSLRSTLGVRVRRRRFL